RIMDQSWPVRVVAGENYIRKITFKEWPNTLEELISELKKLLSLQYNFILHYEDQDFNNAFCNVPYFSVNTEYRLRQENLIYMRDGTGMSLSRDMKHDILQKLAGEMYKYMALISKHPSLKDLKFKMCNLRAKLHQCGMADVSVNSIKKTRQNREREPPGKNIKRPRRSEANSLPNFLHGEDGSTCESSRQILENEMKKRSPNVDYVNHQMSQTFSLRRKEIVEEQPSVKHMLERWPALFRKQQVSKERKNKWQNFFQSLDHHTPQLQELFKSKKGAVGSTLSEILVQVEIIVRNSESSLITSCSVGDFTQVPVGLLTVIPEVSLQPGLKALHLEPSSIGIILEGTIVMDDIESHDQAVCITFPLIYALHLDYPKCLRNTFDFIQKVMLSLSVGNLRPKRQSLKNQLASFQNLSPSGGSK
uniref:Uncharacterized protein n=1 Tax=Kryptolebias marmoratus TaxID=37003 RepID=A0A3Q3ERP0_KRYMA